MKWLKKQEKKQSKISLEEQRAAKLSEMGAQLRTSRKERGLSLDEVVAMTRISRRLLQAIEQADLGELPEPIYTQGLIREFASTYPLGSSKITINSPWVARPIGQLSSVHLYLVYIFLILFSVNGLSRLFNNALLSANNNLNESQLQSQSQSSAKSQVNSHKNSSISKIANLKNKKASQEKVQIRITLKEKSWIRVVADGKIKYEGELPKGSKRIWKANKELTVRAGNAGGVLVSVNHQVAKQMGKSGAIEELKIATSARQ